MRQGNAGQPPFWRAAAQSRSNGAGSERRVRARVLLKRLTVAEGEWLASVLPSLQGNMRAAADAVRIEDVVLRHRPGRLGIADALDATATLLDPFAAAGATIERRNEWYIDDDDDEDEQPRRLLFGDDEPDLLVSVRVIVDAAADDGGAAAIYWATLALAS